jgi:hypothetical protein
VGFYPLLPATVLLLKTLEGCYVKEPLHVIKGFRP